VRRVLHQAHIRVHLVRGWLHRTPDPHFDERIAAIQAAVADARAGRRTCIDAHLALAAAIVTINALRRAFLADHVEEGATVITDGWQSYRQATAGRYVHRRQPGAGRRGEYDAARRASGCLAGQAVAARHPPGIGGRRPPARLPREFVFRFNRRRSRSRGLVFYCVYCVLEFAVAHESVRLPSGAGCSAADSAPDRDGCAAERWGPWPLRTADHR
jgi:hypothetical protein